MEIETKNIQSQRSFQIVFDFLCVSVCTVFGCISGNERTVETVWKRDDCLASHHRTNGTCKPCFKVVER